MGKSTEAPRNKNKSCLTNKTRKIAHFKNSLKMQKKTSNKKNAGTKSSNTQKNLKNRLKRLLNIDETADQKSQHINRGSKIRKDQATTEKSRQLYETDTNKKFILNVPNFEEKTFADSSNDMLSNRKQQYSNGIKEARGGEIKRIAGVKRESKLKSSKFEASADKPQKTVQTSPDKSKTSCQPGKPSTKSDMLNGVKSKKKKSILIKSGIKETRGGEIKKIAFGEQESKLKSSKFEASAEKEAANKPQRKQQPSTEADTSRTSRQPNQCEVKKSSAKPKKLNGVKGKKKKNILSQPAAMIAVEPSSASAGFKRKLLKDMQRNSSQPKQCKLEINSKISNGIEKKIKNTIEEGTISSDSAGSDYIKKFFENTEDQSTVDDICEEDESIYEDESEYDDFGSDSASGSSKSMSAIEEESIASTSDVDTSQQENPKFGASDSAIVKYSSSNTTVSDSSSETYTTSEGSMCSEEEEGSTLNSFSDEDDFDSENCYISEEESSTDGYSFGEWTDDDDYELPESENEDLYIRRGEAKIYEIKDQDITFDSNDSSAQIFEITAEHTTYTESDSDSSCPELVPITYDNFVQVENISTKKCKDRESKIKLAESLLKEKETTLSLKSVENSSSSEFSSTENDAEPVISYSDEFESESTIPFEDIIKPKSLSELNNTSQMPNSVEKAISSTSIQKTIIPNVKTSPNPAKPKGANISSKNMVNVKQTGQVAAEFFNSFNSRHVLLLLKGEVCIQGTMKATLIAGNAEIFGHNLKKNVTVEFFSPRGYAFLGISVKRGIQHTKCDICTELDVYKNGFMKIDLNYIIEQFEETNHALVLLERNYRNKNVEIVTKFMKENIFPSMNSINISNEFYESEFVLRSLISTKCNNKLMVDPKWECFDFKGNSKILPIGGKGVGKSTLIRYFVNRILPKYKQCLLLDLDIGQPEMFLPQTISATIIEKPLLGPGYFYCTNPEKAFMFGDTNVVMSPISYFKEVLALIKYCQEDDRLNNIPWIVNTMGYNKGFGSELMSIIIAQLRPTDVIQIQSFKDINNYDYIMTPENVKCVPRNIFADNDLIIDEDLSYNLHIYDSLLDGKPKTGEWDMTQKDKRFAMIMSWLGTILSGRSNWFTDVKPYSASIDDLDILYYGEENIPNSDILDVLIANLTYLCKKTADLIECYGIGIVRGIDQTQKKLYLIPSVNTETLAIINTLAISNIPLPTSIALNQGPKVKGLVPYCYNTVNFVASKHIHQFIYRPKSFLQGPRK